MKNQLKAVSDRDEVARFAVDQRRRLIPFTANRSRSPSPPFAGRKQFLDSRLSHVNRVLSVRSGISRFYRQLTTILLLLDRVRETRHIIAYGVVACTRAINVNTQKDATQTWYETPSAVRRTHTAYRLSVSRAASLSA